MTASAALDVPEAVMAGKSSLDIGELRHPFEKPRWAALIAVTSITLMVLSAALIAAAGIGALATLAALLAATEAIIWGGLQIARARLLVGCAVVSPASFPVLHAAIERVCQRLGYTKEVPVFVAHKVDGSIAMTSYLGTRVILIEGTLVAELCTERNADQLEFLLAVHYGALRAGHARWAPAIHIVRSLKPLVVVIPFLAAWSRSITYSGDRIAFAVCGNLRGSLEAFHHMLAGTEGSRDIGMSGVLDQVVTARQRWLPQSLQIFAQRPHLTNRYLHLLAFARQRSSEQFAELLASIEPETSRRLQHQLIDIGVTRGMGRSKNRASSGLGMLALFMTFCSLVGLNSGVVTGGYFGHAWRTSEAGFSLHFASRSIGDSSSDGLGSTVAHTIATAVSGIIPIALVLMGAFASFAPVVLRRKLTLLAGCSLVGLYGYLLFWNLAVTHQSWVIYVRIDFVIVGTLLIVAALFPTRKDKEMALAEHIDAERPLSGTPPRLFLAVIAAALACVYTTNNTEFVGLLWPSLLIVGLTALPLLTSKGSISSATLRQQALFCGIVTLVFVLTFWSTAFAFLPAVMLLLSAAADRQFVSNVKTPA